MTGPALLVAGALGDPPVSLDVQLPTDSAFVFVLPRGVPRLTAMTVRPAGEFRLTNTTRQEALTPLDDDVVMLSPARFNNPTGHVGASPDPFLLPNATHAAGARVWPHVVFNTAHDSHGGQAFELGAVDHPLTPLGALRFDMAVTRPQERVFVRLGQRLVPVCLAEVRRLDADGNCVALVAEGRLHLLGMPLSALLLRQLTG